MKTGAMVEETYISATMSSINPVRKTIGSNLRFLGNKIDSNPLAHDIYKYQTRRVDCGMKSCDWIHASDVLL